MANWTGVGPENAGFVSYGLQAQASQKSRSLICFTAPQVQALSKNIEKEVTQIRDEINQLAKVINAASKSDKSKQDELTGKVNAIGDNFMRLEKCAGRL
jgi:seryl-tRNA synthetase